MTAGKSRTLFLENVRAFAEVFAPPSTLLVVGASHVAMPLVTWRKTLGFRTIVIDGRPRFATRSASPTWTISGSASRPSWCSRSR